MTKQEKQKIELALIAVYDKTLKEQDIHCDRIAVMEKFGNEEYLKKLTIIGAEGLIKAMKGEASPASYQDRQQLLEQKWDEIPLIIRINQIKDKDIRHRTYFLGEVVEQCSRIKAMATFFETLEASTEDPKANRLYRFWKKHNVLLELAEEQVESGNKNRAKTLQEMAKVTVRLIDVLVNKQEMSRNILLKGI